MGRTERRFVTAVWIDVVLFENLLLFLLLNVTSTDQSTLIFLLHTLHVFVIFFGFGALAYPGRWAVLRPLSVMVTLAFVADLAAVGLRIALVFQTLDGRTRLHQAVYALHAFAFLVNDVVLFRRALPVDRLAEPPPPGIISDAARVLGVDGLSTDDAHKLN